MKLPAPRPRPAAAAVSKRKTPGALIEFDALLLSAAAVEVVWSSDCLKGLILRGLVGWVAVVRGRGRGRPYEVENCSARKTRKMTQRGRRRAERARMRWR